MTSPTCLQGLFAKLPFKKGSPDHFLLDTGHTLWGLAILGEWNLKPWNFFFLGGGGGGAWNLSAYSSFKSLGNLIKATVITNIIIIIAIIIYYINTNEIPGELSCENMISSHVKITCYFHMWKYHCCYGYIINCAFCRIKLFQWNGLVFHWCSYNK